MENFAVISAFALGLFGSVFSIIQFFYQRQQAEKDREQAEKDRQEAAREAAKDREQAVKDREQAVKDREQAEKDREQAVRDRQEAAREAAKQAEKQDLKDRLTFLTQVIIDKDIPRESRQPFYDEYIAKGGNGTVIKFWLENK